MAFCGLFVAFCSFLQLYVAFEAFCCFQWHRVAQCGIFIWADCCYLFAQIAEKVYELNIYIYIYWIDSRFDAQDTYVVTKQVVQQKHSYLKFSLESKIFFSFKVSFSNLWVCFSSCSWATRYFLHQFTSRSSLGERGHKSNKSEKTFPSIRR